jgi:hypothetical protein
MHEKSEKKPRASRGRVKIERLELNKETIQELTDLEAEEAEGGAQLQDVGIIGTQPCPAPLK